MTLVKCTQIAKVKGAPEQKLFSSRFMQRYGNSTQHSAQPRGQLSWTQALQHHSRLLVAEDESLPSEPTQLVRVTMPAWTLTNHA